MSKTRTSEIIIDGVRYVPKSEAAPTIEQVKRALLGLVIPTRTMTEQEVGSYYERLTFRFKTENGVLAMGSLKSLLEDFTEALGKEYSKEDIVLSKGARVWMKPGIEAKTKAVSNRLSLGIGGTVCKYHPQSAVCAVIWDDAPDSESWRWMSIESLTTVPPKVE